MLISERPRQGIGVESLPLLQAGPKCVGLVRGSDQSKRLAGLERIAWWRLAMPPYI